MKIRIKDNSLRFRLTQTEVAKLYESGNISSSTQFVGQPFIYAVEKEKDLQNLSAEFVENKITLKIPDFMAEELATADTIGFDGTVGKVKLLIEKDFVCIDNTLEDQSDNYPNPSLKC